MIKPDVYKLVKSFKFFPNDRLDTEIHPHPQKIGTKE